MELARFITPWIRDRVTIFLWVELAIKQQNTNQITTATNYSSITNLLSKQTDMFLM